MNSMLLRDSLEVLIGLREESRGKVDDSVIEKLDALISEMQRAINDEPKISALYMLEKIGIALDLLAFIKAIIDQIK